MFTVLVSLLFFDLLCLWPPGISVEAFDAEGKAAPLGPVLSVEASMVSPRADF